MLIWCWDFDHTITRSHTYYTKENAALLPPEKIIHLRNNIRNCDWLERFIRKCHVAGDKIFITSDNLNRDHIIAYMQALLGKDYARIIDGIVCDKSKKKWRGRNDHIQTAIIENGIIWPVENPSRVILVDDAHDNCVEAERNGYRAVWAQQAFDDYKDQVEKIAASREDIGKAETSNPQFHNSQKQPDLSTESIPPILSKESSKEVIGFPLIDLGKDNRDETKQIKLKQITDCAQAKKYLDGNIFNQNAEYSKKRHNLNEANKVFDLLCQKLFDSVDLAPQKAMDQISDFFDHINDSSQKEKLNCHNNKIYDRIFFKENTISWSNMVSNFRNKSLAKLLEIQKKLPEGEQAEFLNRYRNKALFAEHRGNSFFTRLYNTDSVKIIDNAIKECEKNTSKIATLA